MPSPILARADALMHRRRATSGDSEDVPLLTEAEPEKLPDLQQVMAADSHPVPSDDNEDIPVLLDVDSAIEAAAATPPAPMAKPSVSAAPARQRAGSPDTPAIHDFKLPNTALQELSQRIEQRLTALLPVLIAETLNDYLQEQAERDRH